MHDLPDLLAAMEEGFGRSELATDPAAALAMLKGGELFFDEWRRTLADASHHLPSLDQALAATAGGRSASRRPRAASSA